MKKILRRVAILSLGVGLLAAAIGWQLLNSPATPKERVLVQIPRGMPTRQVADLLAQHGIIASPISLLALRATRPNDKIQAGEYEFKDSATPWEVYSRLARGDVFYYELRVPEGSNLFDIAELAGGLGLFSKDDMLAAARDPSLIRDLAPAATSLEGYLFPSTYRLTRGTTARDLAKQMTGEFRRVWKQVNPGQADVHHMVTLASLVEKETGAGSERPMVASVFANRLRQGIKLECDPTTIYAALLEGRWRGTIYRSDLDNPHPYNTYRNFGLPPGPIANPGKAAIEAALRPAETPYIFFVAHPDGGRHQFSQTLAQHERAVAEYRRGQTQQAAQPQGPSGRVAGRPQSALR